MRLRVIGYSRQTEIKEGDPHAFWNCRHSVDCGPAVVGRFQGQRDVEPRLEFIAGRPSLTADLVISLSAGAFGHHVNWFCPVAAYGFALWLMAKAALTLWRVTEFLQIFE